MAQFPLFRKRDFLGVAVSILLGTSLGFFVHGCKLIDIFPSGSNWLLLSTILISMFGIVGYFFLFRWMRNNLSKLSDHQATVIAGISFFIAVFLLLEVIDCWQKPSRYIDFFLPVHTLQVSVSPSQASAFAIMQFNTSLGNIPLDTLDHKGWKLVDDQLVLTDISNNNLHWAGKTGGEVQITFESSSPEGEVVLSWDKEEKVFPLFLKKYVYTRSFNIPFFASPVWIVILGVVNILAISLPFYFLIRKKQTELVQYFTSLMPGSKPKVEAHEWIFIAGVMALALLLRIPNINMWSLVGVDEYSHLNAAKWIVENSSLAVEYERSLWLVTLPISLGFKFLGVKIWVARLTGVLFNVISIIPLYLIARKINREVAILSVLLFATSPWVIVFSRIVREYAYYPFYYYLIIYWMILFLEKIPDHFCVYKDWKILFTPSMMWLEAGLVLPPIYALYIDPRSTFKLILLAYLVFVLCIFIKMNFRDRKNAFILLGAGILISAVGFLWIRNNGFFDLVPGFNPAPLEYFFPHPPQQWYFNRLAVVPVAALLSAILLAFLTRKKNPIPFIVFCLFVCFLGFFVFSSNSYFAPRHLTTTLLWYVVLLAVGIYIVWVFLQGFLNIRSRTARIVTILVLCLITINPNQILLPVTSRNSVELISGDHYYDMTDIQAYMVANFHAGDILISSTPYLRHGIWAGKPKFSETHFFPVYVKEEDILSLTYQNNSGWIVIDTMRAEMLPFSPFETFSRDERIEYIGLFGDEYLWYWKQ
jgi:Dolichyl-phosphate-mannose-protein mannosyltransferase